MTFDLQPTLNGNLLRLRPLVRADHAALYEAASDPLIWEQHPAADRHRVEGFSDYFHEALESGGALTAIDRQNELVIGSSRYHGYDAERSEIEIGWAFLARSYWGGQYNREMKHLMLEHAFRFVNRVLFRIHPQNIRSQRATEKVGASRVGSGFAADGRPSFVYEITAATFRIVQKR